MPEIRNAYDASIELSRLFLSESDSLISKLESASTATALTANDCLKLWTQMGQLRHGVWSEFSTSERADFDSKAKRLEARLKTLLAVRGQELPNCLESGMSKVLREIDHSCKEVNHFLKKREISSTFTSAELNGGLFYWRDELGFALLFHKGLGLELSPNISNRVERLDAEVRKILPNVLKAYREAEDDPTPYPDRFPESFWWRRVNET